MEFKLLTRGSGTIIDETKLADGFHVTHSPKLYPANFTIEMMVDALGDSSANSPKLQQYINNLKQCRLISVNLTFNEY